MSIRVKLVLTYAALLLLSAAILIFSGIAVITGIISTTMDTVFVEDEFNVIVRDVLDLLVDIRQAEEYQPEALGDPAFIKDLALRTDFYRGGLIVKADGQVYNYNRLPVDQGFYQRLQPSNHDQDYRHETPQDDHLIELDDKRYYYIDYSFGQGDNRADYYFVIDVSNSKLLNSQGGQRFMSILLAILIIIMLPLLLIISKDIIKPVRTLKKGVERIKQGDLSFSLSSNSKSELGEVIRSFDVMRAALKDSIEKQVQYEENRKELITSISHDLKTPITSIKGHIEGIRDGIAKDPERLEKYLSVIYQQSRDMDQLIDDLFLFSKLDLQKLPFSKIPLPLVDFVEGIIEEMRLGWEDQHHHIDFLNHIKEENLKVLVDQQQFKRVIVNILHNAMKYMDKEQQLIRVTLSAGEQFVKVLIEDNGRGIPKEHLDSVFERFYRVEASRNLASGGTGLGLAIAKQIVTQHDGQIYVSSEEGKGTKMVVQLPLYKGEEHEENSDY